MNVLSLLWTIKLFLALYSDMPVLELDEAEKISSHHLVVFSGVSVHIWSMFHIFCPCCKETCVMHVVILVLWRVIGVCTMAFFSSVHLRKKVKVNVLSTLTSLSLSFLFHR